MDLRPSEIRGSFDAFSCQVTEKHKKCFHLHGSTGDSGSREDFTTTLIDFFHASVVNEELAKIWATGSLRDDC